MPDHGQGGSALLGSSKLMRRVIEQITEAASAKVDVLITGETGTGKELVAGEIHRLGVGSDRPFIAKNCGAIPESLVESELFGYEKGAFSGATARRPGAFHEAHGGTLFLDEIAEMARPSQTRLLRVIQEREVVRVGSNKVETIDVRIIYATHQDLRAAVDAGRFREDLFFRIRSVIIKVPPLRERPEDVPELADLFRQRYAARFGKVGIEFAAATICFLQEQPWPGNVRELEHTIERTILSCKSNSVIQPSDISIDNSKRIPLPGKPDERPGPPRPSDPEYERIERPSLVSRVREDYLNRERVAVLLEPHRGGGKTLARQIAGHYSAVVWLTAYSAATCSKDEFYQELTRNRQILNQTHLHDWIVKQSSEEGLLVVLFGTRGPEILLNEVARVMFSLRQDSTRRYVFLIVGGENLLKLRSVEDYFWFRFISGGSYFDVPEFSVDDVARLLRLRGHQDRSAPMIHRATGGHPWLLYQLLGKRTTLPPDEVSTTGRIKDFVQTWDLRRHLSDPQGREVLQCLLKGERVAPLGDIRVRSNPFTHAESRLYFAGFLNWDSEGSTQLRCPAVQLLVEEELLSSPR